MNTNFNHPIPRSEFQQRIKNIRKEMSGRGLDALMIYSQKRSHVRYVSGYEPNYHTHAALVLLPLEGEPVLWIKYGFDLWRAKAKSRIRDVRMAPYEASEALITACAEEILQRQLDHGLIGLVASDLAVDEMSVSLDQCLRNALPQVRFEPASDLMNSLRIIKSAAEIKSLRASTQLAEAVAEALGKAIKPGETDLHAVLAAERPARAAGARCDVIVSTDSSRLAYPATGLKFRRKSTVICEITVELNGYWVQICRTFSLGKPSEKQKQLFAVSQRAYLAALAATRSGNTAAAVWKTLYQSISGDGCEKYIPYGLGHGVGLDLPELYIVDPKCESELRPNMVLVIHPGVFVPGRGASFTGGPVIVGETKARPLDHPQMEIIEI